MLGSVTDTLHTSSTVPLFKKLAAGLLQPLELLADTALESECGTGSIENKADDHGPSSDLLKSIVGSAGLKEEVRILSWFVVAGVVPFMQSVRGDPCEVGLPFPIW